ncbi:unnamed protein product, partial [Meganyctiphanes norvegica]
MLVEIILFLTLLAFLVKVSRPPTGLPPGLWGLPFIGSIPDTSVPFTEYIHGLAKRYGDIFYLKAGSRLMFFISDFDMAKTAYSGHDAVDRPDMFTLQVFSYFKPYGIITSNGELWQSNKRSSLRYLRDFGMGKTSLQDIIQYEAAALIKDLHQFVGKPTKLSWNLNVSILNILWKIVADRRFEVTDKRIQNFANLIDANVDIMSGPIALLDICPSLIPLLPTFLKNKWMKLDVLKQNRDLFYEYIMEEVENHRNSVDPENPRDLIDSFLIEMKEKMNDNENFLNLSILIAHLFVAGSDTTSNTIRWTVLYMALYPHVQKRVQEEIDNVVGSDRQPGLEDRESLMYLEAVINEVHRKASLVPFSLPHQSSKEIKLGGYTIPKDSILLLVSNQIHNDKRYWEKPDMFYPEHFLDENGKVLTKKDGYLPFSIGRRQCVGESLARMSLFLFCAAFLQKYNISAPPGEKLTEEPDPKKLLIRAPKPFRIILTKRHF